MDFDHIKFFDQHAYAVAAATPAELKGGDLLQRFTLGGDGAVDVCYAPFDFVASGARLVIVGITPGRTQAINALVAASAALKAGKDLTEASRLAKLTGSFSGPMRANLVCGLGDVCNVLGSRHPGPASVRPLRANTGNRGRLRRDPTRQD